MTAYLLTLNFSETEFLLIGLPQPLVKMNTCLLVTTHFARNIGLSSINTLLSLLSLINLAIIIFVNVTVFVRILTLQ